MRIHIWIKKEDAISGNITTYYTNETEGYVQVSITQDVFTILEDNITHYSASIDGPGVPIDKKNDQEYSQDNWNNGVEKMKRNKDTYPDFVKKHYGKK